MKKNKLSRWLASMRAVVPLGGVLQLAKPLKIRALARIAGFIVLANLTAHAQICTVVKSIPATPPTSGHSDVIGGPFAAFNYSTSGTIIYDSFDKSGEGNFVTIPTDNTFWINTTSDNGPLNRCGIWGSDFGVSPVGFSVCVTIATKKVYYMGFAADNWATLNIDAKPVIQQSPTGGVENFTYWRIYKISLSAGKHYIEILGSNGGGPAAFGFEIYDNTPAQIMKAQSYGDLNLVFSTKDQIGKKLTAGNPSISYSCPIGYSLDYCSSPVPSCSQIISQNISLAVPAALSACASTGADLTSPQVTKGSSPGLLYTYWLDNLASKPLIKPNKITTSGTYYIKGTNATGCDVIKPVTVTINTVKTSTINMAICGGQSYLGYTKTGTYTDLLVAASGCDSIRTLNLTVKPLLSSALVATICNGQNYLGYTKTGVYTDTLVAASGCDSIRTVNLTVKPKASSTFTASICSGQNYFGYTKTGVYKDTLVATNGCDSIRTLNLTVKPVATSSLTATVCAGQQYLGYTKSGTYIDTLVAANGCDSIRTLKLIVKPLAYSFLTATICSGQQYLGYIKTGVYKDTLLASNGCDSIRTLTLTVKALSYSNLTAVICEGANFFGYTKSGTYHDVLVAANGCDSNRTINLTVKPTAYSALAATICDGQQYLGYAKSGTYADTLVAADGCDSIRTLTLTVKLKSYKTVVASICEGQVYLGYTKSGIYTDTFTAANGCDSIRTLNLTVYEFHKPYLEPNINLCFGDTATLTPGDFAAYQWQDNSTLPYFKAKTGGRYWVKVFNANNCEATVSVFITMTICRPIIIPNTFSPNNDGINDKWDIQELSAYQKCTIQIFNRYGQSVFTGKGGPWDGTANGKNMPVGTYYYVIDIADTKKRFSGWLLLIR